MPTFTYVHGDTLKVDHTESGAVSGNSLVVAADIADGLSLAAVTSKDAGITDGYVYPNGTAVFDLIGFDLASGTDDFAEGDILYYSTGESALIDDSNPNNIRLGKLISSGAAQTDNFRIVFGG